MRRITLDENPLCSSLPFRLFRGNPNLEEISLRGNNLHTLDAAQLPLDRLKRLNLANNPFVCNCSLQWLWRLTHIQINDDKKNDRTTKEKNFKNLFNNSLQIQLNQNENLNSNRNPNQNHIDSKQNNVLSLDVDGITCNQIEDSQKFVRHFLKDMSNSDMNCPTGITTVVCAIISVFLVLIIGIIVLYYMLRVKNRGSAMSERKNVNERIVPQQVDKSELERYLQCTQEMENEYRALRQWEVTAKEQSDTPDHYEECNSLHYDTRRPQKPHVVYV